MATTEQRLKEYERLYKQAQGYDPNKFQNEFERAYGEATGYNQDLINQQSQSLGELQSVAPTLRSQYMDSLIVDPTKQMALIAQARQAPITSFSNAANLLGARGQRYQDILGKALSGYQTSAQQANTAAENAWRLYQDAVAREEARRAAAAARTSVLDLFPNQPPVQPQTTQQQQETPSYWQTLSAAADWQPENKTAANIYNTLTNTLGRFVYENPTPISFLKNLFSRKPTSSAW